MPTTPSRRRPSASTVIAIAALGLSLGGTSYAAATVGTNDIKNGAVTGVKVKDGSLLGADLAAKTINNSRLKDGAVDSHKIADGSILGADVKDGELTGADVKDGGLTGADLADGSVAAADVAPGTFLGAGDKAKDADKLDGLDSTAFVQGRGQITRRVATVPFDNVKRPALVVPGVGLIMIRCAPNGPVGAPTLSFRNLSGGPEQVFATSNSTSLALHLVLPANQELATANFGNANEMTTFQIARPNGVVATYTASIAGATGTCAFVGQGTVG